MIDLNSGPCLNKRLRGCGAGSEYLAVTADGNLYPCHQFAGMEDFYMGNVHDADVDQGIKRCLWIPMFSPKRMQRMLGEILLLGRVRKRIPFHRDIRKPYEIGCETEKKADRDRDSDQGFRGGLTMITKVKGNVADRRNGFRT